MRIIFVNQYYEPDSAPTARYLGDLARALSRRGHDVHVLCSRRRYDGGAHAASVEVLDGVQIRRLSAFGFGRKTHAGRLLDYGSFYLRVSFRLLLARPRPDVAVSLTTPPFLGFAACVAARLRRFTHIHWVMDIYPDVMLAHGMLRPGSAVTRMLYRFSRYVVRHSALTITLGPDMQRTLEFAAGDRARDRVRSVPLWVPPQFKPTSAVDRAAALRRQRGWSDDTVVFLYSGNMGLGHRLDEFLEAATRYREQRKKPPVRMVFAGGGRRRAIVEAFVEAFPDRGVELIPYAKDADLAAHLLSADVLLLSLEPAWRGCMLPSKIQTALASGRPVLFVGPPDSTPARWISDNAAGWVVPPGDVEALLRVLSACADPQVRERHAARAVAFARKAFDAAANRDMIAGLLESSVEVGQDGSRGER